MQTIRVTENAHKVLICFYCSTRRGSRREPDKQIHVSARNKFFITHECLCAGTSDLFYKSTFRN